MTLPVHQARHTLGNLVFAIVAAASFLFWGVELRFSNTSYDTREAEVLAAYQQRLLDRKAEALRDVLQEIHQTARTISLLPEIREATGGNRRSLAEDVVRQGRLSPQTYRMLQQVYANLGAYTRISEIYMVLDGFDPERGEVPFFMFDDQVAGSGDRLASQRNHALDIALEDESFEYAEILVQLQWFRQNAPKFDFGAELNAIPARISSLLPTCDNTQLLSRDARNEQDVLGLIYSVPVYGLHSEKFKGQVSIIVRANVLEAKLLDVPYLPVTPADRGRMAREGWKMPPPTSFILQADDQGFEIADRRNALLKGGVAAARRAVTDGRWAAHQFELPHAGHWTLHHHLAEDEIEALVHDIRVDKRLSVAGRVLLLCVLTLFLGWGFWLMRASRNELLKLAHYDQLTDLPNRRLFFDRLTGAMARAQRNGSKVGLFFVDLAGLNAINDRYGHYGGDLLLTKFARRLHEQLRGSDEIFEGWQAQLGLRATSNFMVARLGGDEFTILCEDLHVADDLIAVAERLVDCAREPFVLGDEPVEVRLNIGAALYPDDADAAERLLMSADSAMHECKNQHGRYVLFDEEMRQRGERLHLLTLELRNALQKRQFELFYQPKATLHDARVVSMEALIRWHHPKVGLVMPHEFIPILERNGAIVEVGEWIVEQACRDLHRLSAAGFPDIRLSVNVSVHQLRRGNFRDFLERALQEGEVAPQRLILEITETMVIDDLQKGRDALQELKALGVSLAIDDFGAGYSSLTYLQHLPVDSLKIDKSLVDGMVDARAISVVESVIHLAQGLSLKTIAEGIETEEQRALIQQLGCDMMQGFLLSRPLPLGDIIDWLKTRQS